MQNIQSIQQIIQLNELFNNIKSSIDVIIKQNNEYINNFNIYKGKSFQPEKSIDKTETLLDQLDDLERRNTLGNELIKHFQDTLDSLQDTIDTIVESMRKDTKTYKEMKSKLIDSLIEMNEELEMEELQSTNGNEMKKKEIEEKYSKLIESYQKYVTTDGEQEIRKILSEDCIFMLEEWTGKDCSEIVFQSSYDEITETNCQLQQKINGKEHLAFLIEDTDGELFGFYFNPKIVLQKGRYGYCEIPCDNKCFEFNLIEGDRNDPLDEPTKFTMRDLSRGLKLSLESSDSLLSFGDITMHKKGNRWSNYVAQYENIVEYHSNYCGLCGKAIMEWDEEVDPKYNCFTPTRIIVIQMK